MAREAPSWKRFVVVDPHGRGPDEARLLGTSIPVWAVVGYLRSTGYNVARTAAYFNLSSEAIAAALSYSRAHPTFFERRNPQLAFGLWRASQSLARTEELSLSTMSPSDPFERVALALEGLERGDFQLVAELMLLEAENRPDMPAPNALAQFFAQLVRLEIAYIERSAGSELPTDRSIAILDSLIEIYDLNATQFPASDKDVAAAAAFALLYKALLLGRLSRPTEELATCDDLVARFGDRHEPEVVEQVAAALNLRRSTLTRVNQPEMAITVYDSIVARYSERSEPAIGDEVAKALIAKVLTLANIGQAEVAVAAYDEIVSHYGRGSELSLARQVARALIYKAATLVDLQRATDAVAV